MTKRDEFLRQATAPLRRAPTRPVGGATGDLGVQAEDALTRARPHIEATAQAILTLHEACRRIGAPPPGVPAPPAKALSPSEEAIVAHLAQRLPGDAELRRRVQIAVFRHHEARMAAIATEAARDAGKLEPAQIERLRQTLYYLSVYHIEFQGDPLLRQLFPAPRTHAPGQQGEGALSQIQRLKRKLAQEAALELAKELADGLAMPMAAARLVLEMVDGTRGMGLKDLIDPKIRHARLVAVQLSGEAAAVALLRQARADYDGLKAALAKLRSHEDAPTVEKAALPLSGFEAACRAHPTLKLLLHAP